MDVTSGAGTVRFSRAFGFTPGFEWGLFCSHDDIEHITAKKSGNMSFIVKVKMVHISGS